jgi:hypothetical protein
MLVMGDCDEGWLVEWLVVGMLVVGELVIDEWLGELSVRVFVMGNYVTGELVLFMGNCINGVVRIDSLWRMPIMGGLHCVIIGGRAHHQSAR